VISTTLREEEEILERVYLCLRDQVSGSYILAVCRKLTFSFLFCLKAGGSLGYEWL